MRFSRALVALVSLVVLRACGSTEPPARPVSRPPPPPVVADAAAVDAPVVVEPGGRLPEGIVPVAYDLRLEVSAAAKEFTGHVAIRVRLAAPTRNIELHMSPDLELSAGRVSLAGSDAGEITDGGGVNDLRTLELPRSFGPGEITLELSYRGASKKDQEGLFHQKGFLFSQAEAAFARRFVPCFDEPRFKTPWRVRLVTPATDIALANAPAARELKLADGRREVVFEEIAALPTYLLAIAVGPFTLVDGGRVGRGKVPLRIAVPASSARRTAYAVAMTPKIVEVLERYFDQPLPLAKLDLVAVPELFGAMEHPGLITFSSEILLGDRSDAAYRRRFIRVCAHEIAHQWAGNLVTPAWWDDLWLAEAFATFLGDKAAAELGGFDDEALRMQIDREDALAADAELDPSALHRAIGAGEDIDATFDAIAYEKGRAVLVMFERFVGPDVFRTALRSYIATHARGSATTADFSRALVAASTPQVGAALISLVQHPGTPIVELSLQCDVSPPALHAHARDKLTVPVCVRYPGAKGPARACALVGDRATLALVDATACPAWLVGNESGLGYYQVAAPPLPGTATRLDVTSAGERMAFGDDIAGAVMRGELAPAAAMTILAGLAGTRDPYAELGAIAIAAAIDPLVGQPERAAWERWLARTFAPRLTGKALFGPAKPVEYERVVALLDLIPGRALDRAVVTRGRTLLDRQLRGPDRDPVLITFAFGLAGHTGGNELWPRVKKLAMIETDEDVAAALLGSGWAFGVERMVDVVHAITVAPMSGAARVEALLAVLADPVTGEAAWAALRPDLVNLLRPMSQEDGEALLDGLGALCSARACDGLAAAAGTIDTTRPRARIDRCLTRRAAAGRVTPPD